MSLSPIERRGLQRTVQEKIALLSASDLNPREKREAIRAMDAALAKLGESLGNIRSQKLLDLLAGKFNHLEPLLFLKILKEVVEELNGECGPVKEPTVAYISAHKALILESDGARR